MLPPASAAISRTAGSRPRAATTGPLPTRPISPTTFPRRRCTARTSGNSRGCSQNDIDCNRIRDLRGASAIDVGCTSSPNIVTRDDKREAARIDFEWALGSHQLRFGLDRESNVSAHNQFYPGRRPAAVRSAACDGATMENGVPRPAGITEFVRTRQNEVAGNFETLNSAFYLEDNWSATDTLILNAGVRVEGFDNRNSEGDSYIKLDDMIAPRFGFAWDMKGDGRTKLFGNVGRYFLPVANVINIKQAGGFLDARNWYVFNGFETFEYNGVTRQRPILGAQVGGDGHLTGRWHGGRPARRSRQGHGPVYQDEIILGFQTMINDQWSWGVRGTYRKLTNAIDDMEITSTGIMCDGEPVSNGFVMANPGQDRDDLLRHRLRRRKRCVRGRGHFANWLGDVRLGRQLSRRPAVREAAPHVQGAGARAGSRMGRQVVDECGVYAGVQRRQRGRPGEHRHGLRRHGPHRDLRRSVGELRRLRLSAERSPAPVQAPRRVWLRRGLARRPRR